MTVDGILNVNKPLQWTSFDVVALVRRLSGEKRVGHAGTLDPAAEGVLVISLGQATRVVEYLLDAGKSYRARIRLGAVTDSYDAEGTVIRSGDPSSVTREAVEEALRHFRGVIDQTPPMFSALKRDGVPLYRHARAGREVEREPRSVEIYHLDLLDFAPPVVTVELDCGRGVYVRSLAFDLGERLGCGAHLAGLVRLAVGPFRLESAVSIDALRDAFSSGGWERLLSPIDSVLLDWPAITLSEEESRAVRQGRTLERAPAVEGSASIPDGARCRAYSPDGRLIALLRYLGDKRWQPLKVLSGPD